MRPARCPAAPADCPAGCLAGIDLGATDLAELAEVLSILEDFLNHAGEDVVEQLAAYSSARPYDPPGWAGWVADLLARHAATLRRLDAAAATPPAHTPTGEPS